MMNKTLISLALPLLLMAACKGTGKEARQATSGSTTVASEAQEPPDSLFFPRPDDEGRCYPVGPHSGYRYSDYPTYFAFVGRFASFSEMKHSPFYKLLCQRIPELAAAKAFTVNTTNTPDDVWMLIPTTKGIWCKIKAFTPDMLTNPERSDSAKTYYFAESMEPILIHTPMAGKGSISVDISAVDAPKDFGVNAAAVFVPQQGEREGSLICVPFDIELEKDTFRVITPKILAGITMGRQMKSKDGAIALKFMNNGQLLLSQQGKDRRRRSCSYIAYAHKGKHLIAVKSDDGRRRAAGAVGYNAQRRHEGQDLEAPPN